MQTKHKTTYLANNAIEKTAIFFPCTILYGHQVTTIWLSFARFANTKRTDQRQNENIDKQSQFSIK